MTSFGWVLMLASWALILGLVIFCFVRIFGKNKLE